MANSGLKVRIPYEHSEQKSSVVDKKRRTSEPVRIGEVLPVVMRNIEKRMQRYYRAEQAKQDKKDCINRLKRGISDCQIYGRILVLTVVRILIIV